MQSRVGKKQFHAAEKSAPGVPPRILGRAGVGTHGHHVVGAVAEQAGDVGLKAEVAVVGATRPDAVHPDVARKHYPSEIEHGAAPFPEAVSAEMKPVPACSALLEAAGAQPRFHVCHRIVQVGKLVGSRLHPGLRDLEIVGEIHRFPGRIGGFRLLGRGNLPAVEFPSPVEVYAFALSPAKGRERK